MIKGYMTTDALILFFLFFSLTIAIVIKSLQKKWSFLPFAPTLFVISIVMGKFSDNLGIVGDSIKATSGIDPRGILLIFLPPLIFESSFSSDWYVFRKQASQIFILAFPCVLVGAFIIMFSIKLVIGYDDSYYTYLQAFMFGSVLSCTDTVAVLALLKEAGAPKKFRSLIEGESLVNDGSCMILFTISIELCKGGTMGFIDITRLFVELTGGAVILGVIFGIIATELIKLFKNDPLLCYNTTLVGCYLVYFVAQYVHLGIHVSGIMALVSMGLYMAAFCRTKFTTEARERVHHIWKVYVFVAETIIFILGGVIVGQRSLNNPKLIDLIGVNELLCLLALYVCMTMARFLAIGMFMPKLKHLGYGLKWTEVVALTYGGLRGAVGIAFTLILTSNQFLPEKFRSISIFNMAGCAFLTLMINAPSCRAVIEKLGLCNKSETKVKLFNKFMKICKKELEQKIEHTRSNDKYLSNSNWQKVVQLSGLEELQIHIDNQSKQSQSLSSLNRMDSSQQPMMQQVEIDQNIMIEIRSRFGIALKGVFWKKFQNKECTDQTVKKLTQCVDLDLDAAQEPLNSWDYLISQEQNNIFFAIIYWLRQFPIVNHYAFSQIYQKVRSIYDLVSTYIQAMDQCEKLSSHFPFDKTILNALRQESSHNKKLAQAYLDSEIKNSYPQIMKKVQTSKVSVALLNYQLEMLQKNHKQGRVDQLFYFQMRIEIQKGVTKIQSDIQINDEMPTAQTFKTLPIFDTLENTQFDGLMVQRAQKLIQKDELVVRSYQKMRYIYYVVKGQINEQWKLPDNTFKKRTIKKGDFLGLSELCIPHSEDIEYSAVANSVTCLYGFPIQRIREAMTRNTKFQSELNKQMVPVIVLLSKNIDFSHIPHLVWSRIRYEIEFSRVPRGNHHTVQNVYVILIEGNISIEGHSGSQGYYKLVGSKAIITGPAKYVTSPYPFDDIMESEKRLSSAINKGLKNQGPSAFDKALLSYN